MKISATLMLNPLLVIVMWLLSGCGESSDTLHLRLAHSLDPSHTVHQAMVYMGKRLAKYSAGKMMVDIYPSGQQGSERELIELLPRSFGFIK